MFAQVVPAPDTEPASPVSSFSQLFNGSMWSSSQPTPQDTKAPTGLITAATVSPTAATPESPPATQSPPSMAALSCAPSSSSPAPANGVVASVDSTTNGLDMAPSCRVSESSILGVPSA